MVPCSRDEKLLTAVDIKSPCQLGCLRLRNLYHKSLLLRTAGALFLPTIGEMRRFKTSPKRSSLHPCRLSSEIGNGILGEAMKILTLRRLQPAGAHAWPFRENPRSQKEFL